MKQNILTLLWFQTSKRVSLCLRSRTETDESGCDRFLVILQIIPKVLVVFLFNGYVFIKAPLSLFFPGTTAVLSLISNYSGLVMSRLYRRDSHLRCSHIVFHLFILLRTVLLGFGGGFLFLDTRRDKANCFSAKNQCESVWKSEKVTKESNGFFCLYGFTTVHDSKAPELVHLRTQWHLFIFNHTCVWHVDNLLSGSAGDAAAASGSG